VLFYLTALFQEQVKVKLSRALNAGPKGRGDIAPTRSWSLHSMRWVVSVTPRPRFTPGERTTSTHWTADWVGLRAGLDADARGKLLCLCRGSNPGSPVIQPVVRQYTDWATKAAAASSASSSSSYISTTTSCGSRLSQRSHSCLRIHSKKCFPG
jgi:hypothetical protein